MVLAALSWGVTPAQDAVDPRSVIRECGIRIDARPTGLTALETVCPGLQSALARAQLLPLLIDSSRTRLDRHSLLQLPRLLDPPVAHAPDIAALQPILRSLAAIRVVPRPWWRRLWDWLVEHFTPRPTSSNSWWSDLLQSALQIRWLWLAVVWITLIALVLTIAVVVWREMKAMGRRSADDPITRGDGAVRGLVPSRLALLRATPLGQRPALLFAMLIGKLVAADRLPPDRSLTHREVARQALLDDVRQRHLIESLARLSERQLYARAPAMPDGLADLLSQAEDLYTTGWARPAEPPK
ncbi:MAG TPA: DUF4129 domain-containing protein [Steroidobacteraceae bacterium]|nr:DUF4129 domain-containing protein [Steroidobacteraceae bacterium]